MTGIISPTHYMVNIRALKANIKNLKTVKRKQLRLIPHFRRIISQRLSTKDPPSDSLESLMISNVAYAHSYA